MNNCRTNPTRQRGSAVFIALAIGGCVVFLGCSPQAADVATTPVSLQRRTEVVAAQSGAFLGAESCAASGCHGQALDGSRDWQTAYSVWFADDPHRRACDVLYAERSVEIYRHLHPAEPLADGIRPAAYQSFLHQRCVGCHVTSPSESRFSSFVAATSGVSCESCHGPASGWIDHHYLTSWNGGSGFRDLADLPTRAAVCASCHVGPVVSSGITYDVDHDLIAAGHPRLAFEFDAYLTNYPKHWDETADHARSPGSFHTNAWLCGQQAASTKLIEQLVSRQQPGPEFSSYDCFDCHHALRVRDDVRSGFPHPAPLPLAQLAAVTEDQMGAPLHKLWREAESHLERKWMETEPEPLTEADHQIHPLKLLQAADLPAHAMALRRIPASWTSKSPTWDQAVQFYLAIQALSRDLPVEQRKPLVAAAEQLGTALGPQNFAGRLPTQYDSPATFDPSMLTTPLAEVDRALADIASPPKQGP
jgi:hypothetical protein